MIEVLVPHDGAEPVVVLVLPFDRVPMSAAAAWTLAARLVKAVREAAPDAVGVSPGLAADRMGQAVEDAPPGADLFGRGRSG